MFLSTLMFYFNWATREMAKRFCLFIQRHVSVTITLLPTPTHRALCLLSHVKLLRPVDCSPPGSGVGCHFLFQGIFPTQGSNPCLLHVLHWQEDSLPLRHSGTPESTLPGALLYGSRSIPITTLCGIIVRILYMRKLRLWRLRDSPKSE